MNDWQPSGVITITTDFGHKGPFAAVMKGVILKRLADARVIDLAHDIPAHWPPEAGFWISRSYQYFPTGSVHVAIVDPGVGTERAIILTEFDGHLFMAPDNGLLDPLLQRADDVYALQLNRLPNFGIESPSLTFHGRDIFAPLAAEFAAGRISIGDVAAKTENWTPSWLAEPEVSRGRVSGIVVTIDAFGNLITNIDAQLISEFRNPVVDLAGHKLEIKATYGRSKPGDYLALINSFGVIEIARAEGSAANGLGADRGAPVVVTDSTIKV